MNKARIVSWLCGLVWVFRTLADPAYAGNVTYVATTGNDMNDCTFVTLPCKTLQGAYNETSAGGQITVLDSGDFGPVNINQSVSIINDTSGTAQNFGQGVIGFGGSAAIVIAAGNHDVITLRGLVLNLHGLSNASGVLINEAARVNIENCRILGAENPGILVVPITPQTQPASFNIKVQDTTISGGAGSGIKVTSVAPLLVNAVISRSQIDNNAGGGIRADTLSGGAMTVTVADSSVSLNGANGLIAISGSSGSVLVNLTNDVVASNALAGVESNQSSGGSAVVTVSRSTLSNNGNAWNNVNGGTLLSFQNNEVTGPAGTPPSPASFQ